MSNTAGIGTTENFATKIIGISSLAGTVPDKLLGVINPPTCNILWQTCNCRFNTCRLSNDSVEVKFCDINNFALLYLFIYLFILHCICITFALAYMLFTKTSLDYVSVSNAQRRCNTTNRRDVGLCHKSVTKLLSQNICSLYKWHQDIDTGLSVSAKITPYHMLLPYA